MRLSTEPDRDDVRSSAVLHAAFDAGIPPLDTADAYCWDDTERGHNERLVARALSTWNGDRSRIKVATKGGITRSDGRWETDGRAKHLSMACEHSRHALGVDRGAGRAKAGRRHLCEHRLHADQDFRRQCLRCTSCAPRR